MDIKNRLLSVLITIAIILGGMILTGVITYLITNYPNIKYLFGIFFIALFIGVISDMIYYVIYGKR